MPHSFAKPGRATDFATEHEAARRELIDGLLQPQARISPKYFYDALGSKLFEAICQLDQYYLTRVEAGIFESFAAEIALAAGSGPTLIDLGAGNCEKAAALFPTLKPRLYVPVDISVEFLMGAVEALQTQYPEIQMFPLGHDFSENLCLPAALQKHLDKLFFYPGSSLGNFAPLAATQFLQRIRLACGNDDGAVLIGVDLAKDPLILQEAYDDPLGVTSAFNLNLLRHVNHLLHSDFDIRAWRHKAFFNADQSRIEMHLEAQTDIAIVWPGGTRRFAKGETIHTENSYKFTRPGLLGMLQQAGFGNASCWTDPGENYLVCHARAI